MEIKKDKIGEIAKLKTVISFWKRDIIESYCLVISAETCSDDNIIYTVLDDEGTVIKVSSKHGFYPRIEFYDN